MSKRKLDVPVENDRIKFGRFSTPCGEAQAQFGGMCGFHSIANAFGLCFSFSQIIDIQKKYFETFPDRLNKAHVERLKKYDFDVRTGRDKLLSLDEYIKTYIGTNPEQLLYILREHIPNEAFYLIHNEDGLNVEKYIRKGQRQSMILRLQLPERRIPYFDMFNEFILAINTYNFYKYVAYDDKINEKFKKDIKETIDFGEEIKKRGLINHAVVLKYNNNKWCFIDSNGLSSRVSEKNAIDMINKSPYVITRLNQI